MPREDIVYAVDDDREFLASLRSILEAADFQVRAFNAARELLDQIELRPRSCIVSDIRMPGMDGIALQREIARREFRIPFVFVTGYGDVPLAVDAMKSGAIDFIEKPIDDSLLIDGVNRALEESRTLWERIGAERRAQELLATLSAREMEVFELLSQGLQNAEVSTRLGISPRTVEVHRANLYRKLDIRNLAAVVRIALLAGIASPTDLFAAPSS